MAMMDEDVKRFAAVVFENVRQRYRLDHSRVIPCLVIALGMAEGDLLFTNPEIGKGESRQAIIKTLDEVRDLSMDVLEETRGQRS